MGRIGGDQVGGVVADEEDEDAEEGEVGGVGVVFDGFLGGEVDGVEEAGLGFMVEQEAFEDEAVGGAEGADAVIQVEGVVGGGDDDDVVLADFGLHGDAGDAEGAVGPGQGEVGAVEGDMEEGFGVGDFEGGAGGDIGDDGEGNRMIARARDR